MPMEIPEAFVTDMQAFLRPKAEAFGEEGLITEDELKAVALSHSLELTDYMPVGNRAIQLTFGSGDSETRTIVEY